MSFVHEEAADRAGAGVEIFVAAPYGEVGVPIVQTQLRIADCVCKIEAYGRTNSPRRRDQRFQIQRLTGEILDARQQDQRQTGSRLEDSIDQILGSQAALCGSGLDLDQVLRRAEAAILELGNDGVTIRGKRRSLDQHTIAPRIRPKEA